MTADGSAASILKRGECMPPEVQDKTPMIQQMWKTLEWPIRNGIYFGDDRVIPLDVSINWDARGPTISSKILASVRLSEVKFHEKKTSLIQLCERSYPDANLCVYGGEGSWGSEGFVAVSKLTTGELVWLAYFEYSNPFDEVELVGDNVLGVSTYDHVWKFPLSSPDSLSVDVTKDIGLVEEKRQRQLKFNVGTS
jgi:hypothetical protein